MPPHPPPDRGTVRAARFATQTGPLTCGNGKFAKFLRGWFDFRGRCPYHPGCLARPLGFRGKSSGGGRGSL